MEPLLADKQLSESLGGEPSVPTLRSWRYKGEGPPYIKVGRLIRYRLSDVEAWLERNTVNHETPTP